MDENTPVKLDESLFEKVYKEFRAGMQMQKREYRRLLIIAFICSAVLASVMVQNIRSLMGGPGISISPLAILASFRYRLTIVLFIFLFIFINFAVVAFKIMLRKPYTYDEKRKVYVSETGEAGMARFMGSDEEEEAFILSRNIANITAPIRGRDKDGFLCGRREPKFGGNLNTAIIGTPGSGKSACIVFPDIFQCIRRGDSYIVTDSKGDIYRQSAYIAMKAGYNVKILNLKPQEMINSDGFNVMTMISSRMTAIMIAEIIIANTTSSNKQDFWDIAAKNLLAALILHVRYSNLYSAEDKNLVTVYRILIENSVQTLVQTLQTISPGTPGYEQAQIFCQSPDTVKTSVYQGLAIKLGLLAQPEVQQILMNDEIDLARPVYEKCAYYVVISDQEQSAKFLACLFFTCLITKMVSEVDGVLGGKPRRDVELILDEFKNTGAIPNFDGVLSTVRSRRINIEFILQDITQLRNMYPDGWQTIMNDCNTWLLLKTREPENLKFFSEITGDQTIYTEAKSYSEGKYDPFKIHNAYQVRGGVQKRALMDKHDIFMMDVNEIMINIAGQNTALLKKYQYWEHPFYKIIQNHKMSTIDHIPQWRQRLIDAGEDIVTDEMLATQWKQKMAEEEALDQQMEDVKKGKDESETTGSTAQTSSKGQLNSQLGSLLASLHEEDE